MDHFQHIDSIARLIVKWRNDLLSEQEKEQLDHWRSESPEHAALLDEWQNGATLMQEYNDYLSVDSQPYKAKMKHHISTHRRLKRGSVRKRIIALSSVAAAAIVLFALHLFYHNHAGNGGEITKVMDDVPTIQIADGALYALDSARIINSNGSLIMEKEGESKLLFTKDETSVAQELQYATLTVPRGYTFNITLEDGTEIWLNADSQLRYPVPFPTQIREVELLGEAYFSVAPHPNRPFRVVSEGQCVEVMGTEFNVKTYPQEGSIYTTLIKGQVKISTDANELLLEPGMQAVSDQNGALTVRRVNAKNMVAWREGMLVLEEQTLEQIMCALARWYDFTVVYDDESLKGIVMKGVVPLFDDFAKILNILSLTDDEGIEFTINKNTITMKRKRKIT